MRFLQIILYSLIAIVAAGQRKQYVPAAPYPVNVVQPDGSKIRIKGVGDEFSHLAVTEDGYTVVRNTKGIYEFAKIASDGMLEPSGVRAENPAGRSGKARRFLNDISTYLRPVKGDRPQKSSSSADVPLRSFPGNGSHKIIMLLIQYPNLNSSHTTGEFDNMMNQENYKGTGSFRDYYLEASAGNLALSVDVFGWFTASNNYIYYGDKNGDDRARQLVAEAVDAAEAAGVDFSVYDNDNDGVVDNLMVVHSGPGAEEGAQTDYVWSHSWSLASSARTYDGVTIDPYIIQPETRDYGMVNIGVFCHEFGHALGLPDLYDSFAGDGDSEGLGSWCLMASGSWLNFEKTPAMMSAWTREELGWINPVVITAEGEYSLSPAATGTSCYKLLTPASSEYFLLENRYNTGFDAALPGEGLAIYHINTLRTSNDNEASKLSDLEEADGRTDLDDRVNRGDAGDLFPGSSGNSTFNDITSPNSRTYNGTATGIDLKSIRYENQSIRFTAGAGVEQGIDLTYNPQANALQVLSTTVDMDYQVKNTGTQSAGAFRIAYYLSEDQLVTTSDYLFGTFYVSGIAAGGSRTLNFTGNVKEAVPAIPFGSYYVGYIIDYLDQQNELEEDNNTFVFGSPVVEIIPRSNLTTNAAQNFLTVDGYNLTAVIQVENNGETTSGPCRTGFYLSTDQSIGLNDYFIGSSDLPALNPGEKTNMQFQANVMDEIPDLPPGMYYVGFFADDQNQETELNESDNKYVFTETRVDHIKNANLTWLSDGNSLEITSSNIHVEFEVFNDGETGSGTTYAGLYLSTDAVLSGDDYLAKTILIPALEKDNSMSVSSVVDIVSLNGKIERGSYYIGYFIDYRDEVDELDENDNKYTFTQTFLYCPPDVKELTAEICEGEIYRIQGNDLTEAGTYEYRFTNRYGCDSVIILHLSVNYPVTHERNEVICQGESATIGEESFTVSGRYIRLFETHKGCDSTVILNLEVEEPVEEVIMASLCPGDSVGVDGKYYQDPGTYIHHLTSIHGCDSTVILVLKQYNPSDTLITKTICSGDSTAIGNEFFNQTGLYTRTLTNRFGCDSLVTLDLVVYPSWYFNKSVTLCQGDTAWIGDEPFISSGTYERIFITGFGCDSVVTLDLTVNPVHDTLLTVALCRGESITVGNSVYNETGIYTVHLINRYGCDSLVTLDLTIYPVHETLLVETICEGEYFFAGGREHRETGIYTYHLTNRFGCDSVVWLDLTVNPVDETEISGHVCAGEVFSFAGNNLTEEGEYEYHFSNRFGCDSLVRLYLEVMPLPIVDLGGDRIMFTSGSLILDAGPGFVSYEWNTGENSSTITIDSKRGTGPALYAVTVTDINGCSANDQSRIIVYDDFSTTGEDGPLVKLFPNPSSGIVMLLLEKLSGVYGIQITDENGRVVYSEEKTAMSEKFVQRLNLTFLTPGMYQVAVHVNGERTVKNLVIAPGGS